VDLEFVSHYFRELFNATIIVERLFIQIEANCELDSILTLDKQSALCPNPELQDVLIIDISVLTASPIAS